MTCTEIILGLIIIWGTLSALLCIVLQRNEIEDLKGVNNESLTDIINRLWISAEDRLPEEGKYVLASCDNLTDEDSTVLVGILNDDAGEWYSGFPYDQPVQPTHWMKLPQPYRNIDKRIDVQYSMLMSPKQYYIKERIPEYSTWDDVEDLHEFTASDIVDFADEYISKQWPNIDCDPIVEVKRKKDSGVNVKTEASDRNALIS